MNIKIETLMRCFSQLNTNIEQVLANVKVLNAV